jgi:hypothetical protein
MPINMGGLCGPTIQNQLKNKTKLISKFSIIGADSYYARAGKWKLAGN